MTTALADANPQPNIPAALVNTTTPRITRNLHTAWLWLILATFAGGTGLIAACSYGVGILVPA